MKVPQVGTVVVANASRKIAKKVPAARSGVLLKGAYHRQDRVWR